MIVSELFLKFNCCFIEMEGLSQKRNISPVKIIWESVKNLVFIFLVVIILYI